MKPPNHTTKAEALALLTSGAAQGVAITKSAYRNGARRCVLIDVVPACADDYRGVKTVSSPVQMSVIQGLLRANRLVIEWQGWVAITNVTVLRWQRGDSEQTEQKESNHVQR